MCLNIAIIDDGEEENDETFTAQFNLDPSLGGFVDGQFRYDPNVTEIVIIDNDEGMELLPCVSHHMKFTNALAH